MRAPPFLRKRFVARFFSSPAPSYPRAKPLPIVSPINLWSSARKGVLRIVPLSGAGVIGLNSFMFELNGCRIMVDYGFGLSHRDFVTTRASGFLPDLRYAIKYDESLEPEKIDIDAVRNKLAR